MCDAVGRELDLQLSEGQKLKSSSLSRRKIWVWWSQIQLFHAMQITNLFPWWFKFKCHSLLARLWQVPFILVEDGAMRKPEKKCRVMGEKMGGRTIGAKYSTVPK